MNNLPIYSPPSNGEIRLISFPHGEVEDVIFTFKFFIKNFGNKSEVSFTLELNPLLKLTIIESPPLSPKVYEFDKNRCEFSHVTPEGYFANGSIKIISFGVKAGQFDDDFKNFFFDIECGLKNDAPHGIEGLFKLDNPEKPDEY